MVGGKGAALFNDFSIAIERERGLTLGNPLRRPASDETNF
jgi:hypothetical protein